MSNSTNSKLFKDIRSIIVERTSECELKKENSNVSGDAPMGTMLQVGSTASKHFYLEHMITPEFSKAHQTGLIHIHDLDFYGLTTTCCQIDLLKLLHGGFSTGHGFLREPSNIQSYTALAAIAVQSNQNDQHGGQSIGNFDYAMAEGIRKTFKKEFIEVLKFTAPLINEKFDVDGLVKFFNENPPSLSSWGESTLNEETLEKTIKDLGCSTIYDYLEGKKLLTVVQDTARKNTVKTTYQAMESFIHNLNSMNSRAGAQVPFSSINYGLDTSAEGRIAIRELLKATEAGLGKGETPVFPIQVFRVKDGINYKEGDVSFDLLQLACKVTSKRLFPNFAFQDAPFNLQYYKPGKPETEIAYMGCRTRVIGNVNKDFEQSLSRGNLSFTTINLPRLAILAAGDLEVFFKTLDETLDLVEKQILERFEVQCKRHVYNYPFLMGQGVWLESDKLKSTDEVRDVLKHGTLSIGYIGIAETLTSLLGKHHGESDDAQQLGLAIVKRIRDFCDKKVEEQGLNWSCLATPAESVTSRFIEIDKKEFGLIQGVTDKDYYTNSNHIPVGFKITINKKLDLEAPYHALTNAGHIAYCEVSGDLSKNTDAVYSIIRKMKEAGIGYGSINHSRDFCTCCGHQGIIETDVCPKCNTQETDENPFIRMKRITGYLSGDYRRKFNKGKLAEVHDRVKHS